MRLVKIIFVQNLADQRMRDNVRSVIHEALVEALEKAEKPEWDAYTRAHNKIMTALRGKLGNIWNHGRASIGIIPYEKGYRLILHSEWRLFRKQSSLGAELTTGNGDSETETTLSIRIPFFGMYLGIPTRWKLPRRELGMTYHDDTLWFNLWSDSNAWSTKAPWWKAESRWRQPWINLPDLFLGRAVSTIKYIETRNGMLEVEDGESYIYQARHDWISHKRPRWPRARQWSRVIIELPAGVPLPDGDATHSLSVQAASIDEALQNFVKNIRKERKNA